MKLHLAALVVVGALLTGCGDNTTCVDTADDPMNCGTCGTVCKAAHVVDNVCIAGSCAYDRCADGFGDCDGDATNGCELDVTSDPMNCGACGVACDPGFVTAITCVKGACGYAQCAEGHADCDGDVANGCEADLATDRNHCGGCSVSCDAGSDCVDGHCQVVCAAPLDRCGTGAGFCTLLDDDPANCGACGTACAPAHAANPVCVRGGCSYDDCDTGWADCDANRANGCEANILTDDAHCGGCTACPTGQHCTNGTCA